MPERFRGGAPPSQPQIREASLACSQSQEGREPCRPSLIVGTRRPFIQRVAIKGRKSRGMKESMEEEREEKEEGKEEEEKVK